MSAAPLLDLSKATKLQDVVFRSQSSNIQWIIAALHTVDSEGIQQISLEVSIGIFWRGLDQEWLNLDSLLAHFGISHAFRLKIMYESRGGWVGQRERVARSLPELTGKGIVDLVEYPYVEQAFPSLVGQLI